MEEISIFFYMERKDVEQAIRQWLTKKGHDKRIVGLALSPNDSEWTDGFFQAVFSNSKYVLNTVKDYDTEMPVNCSWMRWRTTWGHSKRWVTRRVRFRKNSKFSGTKIP